MLPEKEDYCLCISSEMHPQQDVFETEALIPKGRILHLTSLQVMCDPMRDETGEANRLKVELFFGNTLDGERLYHQIDLVYTECSFYKQYEGVGRALDGTLLHGDGEAQLIIRRQVEGLVGPQHTHVVVRGHIH